MNEVELINAHCFGLIKRAKETNCQKMTITQENVVYKNEKLGNWKITVEKIN